MGGPGSGRRPTGQHSKKVSTMIKRWNKRVAQGKQPSFLSNKLYNKK